MTIYQIDDEIMKAYMDATDPETGEIVDEKVVEYIEKLEMDRTKKIENAICLYKNIDAEAKAIKTEEDALKTRRKSIEKKAESLMSYIERATNGEKFESARGKVGWRKSNEVVVEDNAFLPDEFLRYKAPEPDKVAIKKALLAGEEIEGASLVEKFNIQIS